MARWVGKNTFQDQYFFSFFLKLEKVQSYRYAFKVKPNYPRKQPNLSGDNRAKMQQNF